MHHFDLLSPKRLLQVEKVISLPLNMSSEHFWSVWKIGQFSARPLHENVILGGGGVQKGGVVPGGQGFEGSDFRDNETYRPPETAP